jgi:hypothetical protein
VIERGKMGEKDNAETQRALRFAEKSGKRFNTEDAEVGAQSSQGREG